MPDEDLHEPFPSPDKRCSHEYVDTQGHYVQCALPRDHRQAHRDGYVHQRTTSPEWFKPIVPGSVPSVLTEALASVESLHGLLRLWQHRTRHLHNDTSEWWLLLGRIALYHRRPPYEVSPKWSGLAHVVHSSQLRQVVSVTDYFTAPGTPWAWPGPDDRCDICGRGWTLETFFDRIEVEPKRALRHVRCQSIHARQDERESFLVLFRQAGFDMAGAPPVVLSEIPNRYWPSSPRPWFVATLPEGDLRIGWRKRVISIEWVETNERQVDFRELFPNEGNITLDVDHIHAWGPEKAVAYLRRLREHLRSLP